MSNIIDSIQLSGVTYDIGGSGGVPESAFTAYTASTNSRISEDEEVTAAALNDLNETISGISANSTVELTQAEYDALVESGAVQSNTYYIITDASAGDLTQYWTSAQTNSAITEATSGKVDSSSVVSSVTSASTDSQIPTAKAVWDVASQGGGGGSTTYTAGRGIDITNDTISFNLPISAGTGTNSIIEGYTSNNASGSYSHAEGKGTNASGNWGSHAEGSSTNATGSYSHAEGSSTKASGYYSHAEGYYTIASGQSEHASGQYNVSSSASTSFGNSGNTLFSVGNGTSDNARHNAFEIRQNGDIYLTKDGVDIKLQDNLGGTASSAITSGDTNPVQGGAIYDKFDEVEQVTAAGLNALNDNFGGLKLVKLSQPEYNALSTKDSSTLYVIVN